MMHTSDNDLCYGHPALLHAVAMLQKVSLYLWERASDGRLIPYSEASYARYIPPKSTQRIDLLVENKLIVENKSVEFLNDLFLAQTLTYLKLSQCKLGLLINFNTVLFKNGVKRVVNGL